LKEGIFLTVSEDTYQKSKRIWQQFCEMSYHDHQNPPSEEMFFDFLKKRNEVGISSNYMEDSYRCLCRVYLYLYGEEFDSSKVQEYVSVESSKNGICPYCDEVSAIFGFNLSSRVSKSSLS
jgi:hypothetical protein